MCSSSRSRFHWGRRRGKLAKRASVGWRLLRPLARHCAEAPGSRSRGQASNATCGSPASSSTSSRVTTGWLAAATGSLGRARANDAPTTSPPPAMAKAARYAGCQRRRCVVLAEQVVGGDRRGHGGHDREAEGAAHLSGRVDQTRGQPGLVGGHPGGGRERHRDERHPDAEADEHDRTEHIGEVGRHPARWWRAKKGRPRQGPGQAPVDAGRRSPAPIAYPIRAPANVQTPASKKARPAAGPSSRSHPGGRARGRSRCRRGPSRW